MTLPNGVASGDVTQDSVVLWTRSTVTGDVTFKYATSIDVLMLLLEPVISSDLMLMWS